MRIDSIPPRKAELQYQMAEALQTNNTELYVLLKGQWAHRFGVETLPDNETLKKLSIEEKRAKTNIGEINDLEKNISEEKNLSKPEAELEEKTLGSSNDLPPLEEKEIELEEKKSQSLDSVIDNDTSQIRRLPEISDRRQKLESNLKPLIPIPPLPTIHALRRWLYN